MAKKKKQDNEENEESKKLEIVKTSIQIMLSIMLLVIILSGLAIGIFFDVGGIGTTVSPFLSKIPVVNSILPRDSSEKIVEKEDYPYKNIAEAVDVIKELELEVDKLKGENDDINSKVEALEKENSRLKEFEDGQKDFEKLKEKFDEDIVYGEDALDTSAYAEYYEKMNPEKAAEIYKKIKEQQEADADVQELANTYAKMEAKNAAEALEKQTDLKLVCDILNKMPQKARAGIMDAMEAEFAAKVTTNMYKSKK